MKYLSTRMQILGLQYETSVFLLLEVKIAEQ